MPLGPKPDNPPRRYFGWPMLGIACLTTIATSPGQSFLVGGLFGESFETGLGLSKTEISLAYLIATCAAAFPLTFVGRASDKFGPRRVMTFVSIGLALACAYMGLVAGFWMLLVGFFLLRFLGQGALSVLSGHTVALWFEKRLGTVESIRNASMALAVLLLPVPIAGLIGAFGWQWTYPILGLMVLLLTMPGVLLIFRNRPEDAGQVLDQHEKPDEDEDLESESPVPTTPPPGDPAFTLRQATATKEFWALAGVPVLSGFVGTAIVFHMFGLVAAGNFFVGEPADISKANLALAATVMAPWAIFSGVATPIGGWLVDRVRPRHILAASPPLLALSVVILWLGMTFDVRTFFFVGMGVFGLSQAAAISASGPTIARWFGRTNHGAIRGFTSTLGVVGTACGPIVLGLSNDLLGGFTPGMVFFVLICVPLVLTVWTMDQPPSPNLPPDSGNPEDPDNPDSGLGPELIDDAAKAHAVDAARSAHADGPPVRYELEDLGDSIPLVELAEPDEIEPDEIEPDEKSEPDESEETRDPGSEIDLEHEPDSPPNEKPDPLS